jgi:hypothetical protein
MDVVGHEAIGPAGDAVGAAALGDEVAIEGIIARLGKQRLSTIARSRHVMGRAGNGDARKTSHGPAITVVAEGQDRALTLPWTRPASRRRREIIQGVGEAQHPLRAMRTKAGRGRDRAVSALRRVAQPVQRGPSWSERLSGWRSGGEPEER